MHHSVPSPAILVQPLTTLTSWIQVDATWLVPDGSALAAMIAQGLMAQHVGTQQGLGPDAAAADAAAADGTAADAAAPGQNGVAAGADADVAAATRTAGEAAAAAVEGGADAAAATGPAGAAAMDASAPTAAPADNDNEPMPGST